MLKLVEGIGARLRGERDRLGLSQKGLGEACGVSLITQHRLETEQTAANTNYLLAAQDAGVDIGLVLAGEAGQAAPSEDWTLIRACVADIGRYCALHWADCPDDYKWALVERLYQRRRQQPATARKADGNQEIEILLGVRA